MIRTFKVIFIIWKLVVLSVCPGLSQKPFSFRPLVLAEQIRVAGMLTAFVCSEILYALSLVFMDSVLVADKGFGSVNLCAILCWWHPPPQPVQGSPKLLPSAEVFCFFASSRGRFSASSHPEQPLLVSAVFIKARWSSTSWVLFNSLGIYRDIRNKSCL